MDISLILTILGSTLGPLVLIYFWLRHLRMDIIARIDEIAFRLETHVEDAKNDSNRKYNLIVQLNGRMDKLYNHILKKMGQIP